MRFELVITPFNEENLKLASQIGVTDIHSRYPGQTLEDLTRIQNQIESFDLKLSVIEGGLPMDDIKLGNSGRDQQIELIKKLLQNMGKAKIPILCYNWMPKDGVVRTSFEVEERGGARVSGFNIEMLKPEQHEPITITTDDQMWGNLDYFLRQVVPVAEENNVTLTMHPDDPPVSPLFGLARIMRDIEAFERLVEIVTSPSNAICFCQGTFAEMGADIPATIRRLGKHIRQVHFRDIRGVSTNFHESFHDNGQTDMLAAMRAYKEIDFDGPIRTDHVPMLEGDEEDQSTYGFGYTMLGRLHAIGYMRGLLEAVSEN